MLIDPLIAIHIVVFLVFAWGISWVWEQWKSHQIFHETLLIDTTIIQHVFFELLRKLSSSNRLTHAWQDSHRLKQKLKNVDWWRLTLLCSCCCLENCHHQTDPRMLDKTVIWLKQNNSNMFIDSHSYFCAACCCFKKLFHSNKLTRAWINSYMIEDNKLCCIYWIETIIYQKDWQNRLKNDLVTWLRNIDWKMLCRQAANEIMCFH